MSLKFNIKSSIVLSHQYSKSSMIWAYLEQSTGPLCLEDVFGMSTVY